MQFVLKEFLSKHWSALIYCNVLKALKKWNYTQSFIELDNVSNVSRKRTYPGCIWLVTSNVEGLLSGLIKYAGSLTPVYSTIDVLIGLSRKQIIN